MSEAGCEWVEDAGCYMTSCKESFSADGDCDDPPEWMKFCCFCGKPIHFSDLDEVDHE